MRVLLPLRERGWKVAHIHGNPGQSRLRSGLWWWLRSLRRGGLLRCHRLRLTAISVGNAGTHIAEQSSSLRISCSPVVPPSFSIGSSGAIPRLECVRVVLSHLRFGVEAFAEFVEHQVGIDRRDACYQDHKHPLHRSGLALIHLAETTQACAGSDTRAATLGRWPVFAAASAEERRARLVQQPQIQPAGTACAA